MVMATYSPQHVGLEFVRQYYTVLHKDPKQLHRFYTKNSFFTHGRSQGSRSDEPIVGQEAIHHKICQLKFRDCYAKIISVDSHPTIGEGVVVQVTGELSNDGLPMRRFMQTFVLAPQAPKKYCVFNDIFRYQDDDFDEENEVNDESPESDSEVSSAHGQIVPPMNEQITIQNNAPCDPVDDYYHATPEICPDIDGQKGLVNGDLSDSEEQVEDFSDNQSAQLEEVVVKPSYDLPEPQVATDQGLSENTFQDHDNAVTLTTGDTEEKKEAPYEQEDAKLSEVTERVPEEPEIPEEPSKPVTWAAMAKKNTHTSPSVPTPAARPAPKPQPQPAAPLPQRGPPRRREDSKSEKTDARRKFNGPPPDSNQIFIGNLPGGISENDVRNIFKDFGNVVEVRINPKNFGFVAFDSSEPVTEILNRPSSKPIMFNTKVINIEEKRSGGSGGNRGGPKREKEGGGRPKGEGYPRGSGQGGRSGQSGGRVGKGGSGGGGGGGGGGGPGVGGSGGFQRQKSGSDGSKGENNRGGRYRDRSGGGPRR